MSSLIQPYSAPPTRPLYLRAIGVNTASSIFSQVLGFLRSVLLARLLSPEAYGLFGLAFVVSAAVQAVINFNMTSNVIRRKFESEEEKVRYLNTTWSAELIRQAVVSLVLLLLSFPASVYFRDSRVFPVLALCSLTPLLNGFTNVGLVLLRKDIQFKNVVLHRQTSDVITTLFAVAVALVTHNVWALAISQVAGALVSVALSYKFHPYRPSFQLDRQVLKESIGFSSHLFFVGLFTYVTTQFDNLVVGRYLGASVVGVYMLAYRLANLPCEAIGDILSPILFPAYSRIRHETPDQLPRMFELAFTSGVAAILATTLPLRLCADWLLSIVYGPQWKAAVPMLALLVFVGILRGMARVLSPLFLAVEKPIVESSSKLVEAILFIGLTLYLVPKYQTTGAVMAGVASYSIAFLTRFAASLYIFKNQAWHLFRQMALVLLSAGAAYGAATWLGSGGYHEVLRVLAFELTFAVCLLATVAAIRHKVMSLLSWS